MLTLDLVNNLWKQYKGKYTLKDDVTSSPGRNGGLANPSAPEIEDNDDNIPPKKVD